MNEELVLRGFFALELLKIIILKLKFYNSHKCSIMVLVGFFRNYFIYKNFLTKMNTITMYFELNIFNNNVKGNVYEQVHS